MYEENFPSFKVLDFGYRFHLRNSSPVYVGKHKSQKNGGAEKSDGFQCTVSNFYFCCLVNPCFFSVQLLPIVSEISVLLLVSAEKTKREK